MSLVLKFSLFFFFLLLNISNSFSAEKQEKLLKQSWSFDGFFG